jgi:hemerythrin
LPLFIWSKSLYGTGIPEIDEQHEQIFQLANDFYDAYKMLRGLEKLTELFGGLLEHANDHFEQEEQLMAVHGYPGLAQHRRFHGKVRATLEDMRTRFSSDTHNRGMSEEMLDFFETWLIGHITGPDRDLANHLKQPPRSI